ncbi:MAG: pitrilysin family protein [Chthoniobacter sp.]
MGFHYELSRLPNGARVASIHMPHMRSVSVGLWAGVGGRHESEAECGASHFLEHLLFKGTKRRNARAITAAVEGVGGYLNAFTTEDHTCYYAKAGRPHFGRLCDVLGDMYVEPSFPAAEIKREREVIREEIMMYRDQPAQHAQELLTATMWPKHPLGRPITGTVESVSHLHRPAITAFHREHYNAANTIATVAGDVSHEEVVETLRPWLDRLPAGGRPRFRRSPRTIPRASVALHTHDTEQTHLAMGYHAWGRQDDRRFALKMLSVLLGENMSSRLFQKLRERHGCCYSVTSGMLALADTGALHIAAGLDSAKLPFALKLILRELSSLAERGPSRAELRMARDYTIGQTLMGLESTSSQIMWMGESLLGYNKVLCPEEVERRIHAVTQDDVRAVAVGCLQRARLGVAVVGPVKNKSEVESWLA